MKLRLWLHSPQAASVAGQSGTGKALDNGNTGKVWGDRVTVPAGDCTWRQSKPHAKQGGFLLEN